MRSPDEVRRAAEWLGWLLRHAPEAADTETADAIYSALAWVLGEPSPVGEIVDGIVQTALQSAGPAPCACRRGADANGNGKAHSGGRHGQG